MSGATPEPRQPDELSDSLTHRAVVEGVDLTVSISDAVKFLESACRNWANVDVDQDDVADVAGALAWFLRHRLSAMPASSGEVGQIEVLFEVWQNDDLVASSTDESDARHYLAVYGQDGAATLVRAETVRTTLTHRGTDGSAEG